VLRASEWLEAKQVIREIRYYELESPPRLRPGVCDLCAESILDRRARTEAVAASVIRHDRLREARVPG